MLGNFSLTSQRALWKNIRSGLQNKDRSQIEAWLKICPFTLLSTVICLPRTFSATESYHESIHQFKHPLMTHSFCVESKQPIRLILTQVRSLERIRPLLVDSAQLCDGFGPINKRAPAACLSLSGGYSSFVYCVGRLFSFTRCWYLGLTLSLFEHYSMRKDCCCAY